MTAMMRKGKSICDIIQEPPIIILPAPPVVKNIKNMIASAIMHPEASSRTPFRQSAGQGLAHEVYELAFTIMYSISAALRRSVAPGLGT